MKFCSQDPTSFKSISSGDPSFENLGSTYLPKNYLSTPRETLALIQLRCEYLVTCVIDGLNAGYQQIPNGQQTSEL